jgi:glycosyltransferase involved in cell wall biosynthesis
MDKVSVIIPTYKGSNTLERAINSVLKQTYTKIEVIIVDDNHPDGQDRLKTQKVMMQYQKDDRVSYIKHQTNKNGAVARNTGILASTGKYIAFLDDDDYYLPERIQKSISYLVEHSDAIGVYTGVDVIDEDGRVNLQLRPKQDLTIPDLLKKEMVIGTGSNIFVKSDIVKKINGFDESFLRRQDIEFMMRVCHQGRVGFLSEKLMIKSTNGVMNHPRYAIMKKQIEQFSRKFECEIEALGEEKNSYYIMQYRTMFDIALYENNKDEIKEAFSWIKKYGKPTLKERLLKIIYLHHLRENFLIRWGIKIRKKCRQS